jgi:hypothetical protein
MRTLRTLFGNPEDVAFAHTYTREPYNLLRSWLRCAEAMLRRLLLIEASAFPKPNTRPLLRPTRKRTRKRMHFSPDTPEKWRVSFRCFGPPASSRQRRGRQDAGCPRKTKRFYDAWPLAERYEALIRVFNDPAPFARGLARRLHALAHRVCELFRAPPEAEHRVPAWTPLRHSAETHSKAAFNTS